MRGPAFVLPCLVMAAVACAACSKNAEVQKQDLIKRGNEYLAAKKHPEAVLEFTRALRIDPDDGQAELGLGNAYHELGDYSHAASSLSRAAELLPADTDLHLRAGTMRLLSGSFEDARSMADSVLAKEPANMVALILRANAIAGMRDIDTAVGEIEHAIELDPRRAELYTNLGSIQQSGGRKEEAEAAFKRAISIAPREPRAYSSLASFYWQTRRLAEAEKMFLKAIELDPSYLAGNRILASFYLANGRPREAERFLKTVSDQTTDVESDLRLADYYLLYENREAGWKLLKDIAARPEGYSRATARMAAREYADGNREEGRRLLNALLLKNASDAVALQLLGHFLFVENKLDEALRRAQAAVRADARLDSAHYLLARIHLAWGNVPEATNELKAVVQLNSFAAPAQMLLAQLQADAGYHDRAIQLATGAVRASGGSPDMRLSLVRVLFAKGDLQRATTEIAEIRKAFPGSPQVLATAGDLHLLKQEYSAARAVFDEALKLDPASLDALNGRLATDIALDQGEAARRRIEAELAKTPERTGLLLLAARVYGALREFPKAEAMMKKAIATNAASTEAYGMLGQFLYQQGRLEEGRQEFEKLSKQQPRNVGAMTMVAIIMNKQGRVDEAIGKYEEVLNIDGDAPVAANNLAWIYAEQNQQLDRAVQLASTAIRRLPDDPGVSDTVGWAYIRRGLPAAALPHLLRAMERRPADPAIRYHLGAAYALMREPAKAKKELEEALRLSRTFSGSADAQKLLDSLK